MLKPKRIQRIAILAIAMLIFVQFAFPTTWVDARSFVGSLIGGFYTSTPGTEASHIGEGRIRLSPQADQYFAGDGSGFSSAKWGSTASGPFNTTFISGNVANFAVPNGTGSGTSITVAGINATENFTITSPGGTISNAANAVIPINVAAGKTLDFASNAFTTSSTAGYSFTGPGTLALAGATYAGGFTLNSGTLVARGINAMGAGATNTLTINGGTIAGSSNRDFSGKYPAGITIGGDFQLGALASSVPISVGGATLTFSNNVSLGSATRAITIGGDGSYVFSGVISGAPGTGLSVNRLPGTGGAVTLTGANTYSGNTTITNGALSLNGSGSIANSPVIEIGSGGVLDVTALTSPMALASGQAIKASGTTATGSINTSSTKGLTMASNSPLTFSAFNGTTPPLTVTGSGTLTLQAGSGVTVNVSNGGTPLAAGSYKLLAKSGTANVSGTPGSVSVSGDGIAAGTVASLVNTSGELFLKVTASSVTLQFSSAAYSGKENGGAIDLTVTRTGGSSGSVGAQVTVADGSATGGTTLCSAAGEDYTNATYAVSFGDGETSKTVSVPVCNDASDESDETFTATLGSVSGGATLGSQSTATVTIIDDDWTVTKNADTNDGTCDSDCSLREAIAAAVVGDTIRFSALFDSAQTISVASQLQVLKALTISGPGADKLTVDGLSSADGAFYISPVFGSGMTTISGMTITGRDTSAVGGAVKAYTDPITLDGVHIRNSTATFAGGGVYIEQSTGSVFRRSTFSGNTSARCGGLLVFLGSATIENSTFSGNTASSTKGGGFCGEFNSTLTVKNSTITNNTAPTSGGGIEIEAGSSMTISSSIVAGNTAATKPETQNDGTTVSSGYNIFGDAPGKGLSTGNPIAVAFGDLIDTNPMLQPLGYYFGGRIPVHSLYLSSPAFDRGTANGLATDALGHSRSIDHPGVPNTVDATDIGAVESLAPTAAPTAVSGRVRTADGRGIANATVTIEGGGLASPVTVVTGSFGMFRFDNIPAGQTYIVTVNARRFAFESPSRAISVTDELTGLDFVGTR